MDKELLNVLSGRLWKHFIPSIQAGSQVYFCVTRELVRALYFDLLPGDTVSLFFKQISQLISVSGDRCEVKPEVYSIGPNGFSLAILLVAQQVLVVEDMVNDGAVSEDAYFPRLRGRIANSISADYLNPFSSEDFVKIWQTFRTELKSSGARDPSITFYAGIGRNKHRSYPLSQALLSTYDLLRLSQKIPPDVPITKLSEESIYQLIRKARFSIRSRARRLVSVPWLKSRIVEQVRSYFSNPINLNPPVLQDTTSDRIELRAFVTDDIFNPMFDVLGFTSTGEQSTSNQQIENLLRNRLERAFSISLCISKDNGGYWTDCPTNTQVYGGDSLIIIFEEQNRSKVLGLLDQYWPGESGKAERINITVNLSAIMFTPPTNPRLAFAIREGTVIESVQRANIEWAGGLCADRRSNTYVIGYPPTGLLVEGRAVDTNSEIKIGDTPMKLRTFLQSLTEIVEPHAIEFEFQGKKHSISMLSERISETFHQYGFPLAEGTFSPHSEELYSENVFLCGLTYKSQQKVVRPFSRFEVAQILAMDFTTWTPISSEKLPEILAAIGASTTPKAVRRLGANLIVANMSCPDLILKRLDAAA